MRSSLIYLLLVGAPLLGLLAILTAGEQLVAPPAIGGSWILQSPNSSPCVMPAGVDGTAEMSVSQSGPRAEATFPDAGGTHLSLRLVGDSLTGSGPALVSDGCAGETFSLNGQLRLTDTTSVISGTLSRTACPTCNPVVFTATRLARIVD